MSVKENKLSGLRQEWQNEANCLWEGYAWLSFLRPRVITRRGFGSPWFFPNVWFSGRGVHTFLFWIFVSEDLLGCDKNKRIVIIAHEIGHIRGFHDFIRFCPAFALFSLDYVKGWLGWMARESGVLIASFVTLAIVALLCYVMYHLYYWFEHEADDYAVSLLGYDLVIDALDWLSQTLSHKKRLDWVDSRKNRLISLRASSNIA